MGEYDDLSDAELLTLYDKFVEEQPPRHEHDDGTWSMWREVIAMEREFDRRYENYTGHEVIKLVARIAALEAEIEQLKAADGGGEED